ncbi:hypothetical protein E2562_026905 [Oryza meyeriana var. granulata]|uniref:Uncharacterized protein n=1 Tax=Oryza meyeriana var. granulata TaxID=110450 RepID=A0A6G1EPN6_9ORYZ|nr:hypothetical protein E2562_026905 [Oryza meyeriana var. granulata]
MAWCTGWAWAPLAKVADNWGPTQQRAPASLPPPSSGFCWRRQITEGAHHHPTLRRFASWRARSRAGPDPDRVRARKGADRRGAMHRTGRAGP